MTGTMVRKGAEGRGVWGMRAGCPALYCPPPVRLPPPHLTLPAAKSLLRQGFPSVSTRIIQVRVTAVFLFEGVKDGTYSK